jgi:homeobox protein cut-like
MIYFFHSVLKSIEFSSSGTDEVDGDVGKTKSLEILLLEKNKTLQTENTQLKVNSNDLSGKSHVTIVTVSQVHL